MRYSILCVCMTLWAASTRDGVFTKEQADRGKAVYAETCATCHGADLAGTDRIPPVGGSGFLKRWEGANLGELYQRISKGMPRDKPESLTARQYSDVSAYMLSFTGFPAGKDEMAADGDALESIKIQLPSK